VKDKLKNKFAKNAIADIRDSASREILIGAHVFEKGNGLGRPTCKTCLTF